MRFVRTTMVSGAVGLLAMALAGPAGAQQKDCKGDTIAPGTLLNAATIDSLKSKCLDGYRLADILPERYEWMIRNHSDFMKLIPGVTFTVPYRIQKLTEQYSTQVGIDANTYAIKNYTSGVAFPNIDPNDPLAGAKVIWNYNTGGRPHGDQFGSPGSSTEPNFVFTLMDAKAGVERIQRWNFSRFYTRGRITEPNNVDENIQHKSLLFASTPMDIKGVGTFTLRYWNGQLDDVWAYIRSVRRVRRLSGGAWVDPIGGTDQLQDDIGFNAHPTWYQKYRLLGKRMELQVSDCQHDIGPRNTRASWQAGKSNPQEEFPRLVFKAPYWNVDDVWMPTLVYVVEAIPPDIHPYSKKIVHIDGNVWNHLLTEAYDRKGDFWKVINFASRDYESADGAIDPRTGKPETYMFECWGRTIDFQRMHATMFHVAESFAINTQGTKSDDFSLSTLEAAGR